MTMTRGQAGSLFAACGAILSGAAHAELPAPLREVQRIVFLGDSITQAGDYVADFDCWLASHGIRIEVLNLGLASETASDLTGAENAWHKSTFGFGRPFLSERLERVLACTKPDVVVACYGMNDGSGLPAGAKGLERFSAAVTRLRDAALKAGAKRVVLCTPPVHDAKGNAPERTHDENLARYSEWLLSKRADGWDVVDIHGPMRKALDDRRAKDPGFAFADDGVHPGREGHWLMAASILKQFPGADVDGISSAEQLFKANGRELRALVHRRMSARSAAWLTKTGHTRPGVPGGPDAAPGPSIDEANAEAARIAERIDNLQAGR